MTAPLRFDAASLAELDRVAQRLALFLRIGDFVALRGPLGAGKTTFVRALLRRLGGEDEVQSPTFALLQSYATPRGPVHHCDFYRLEAEEEVDELGIDELLSEGIALAEWAERAESRLPPDRLEIALEETGSHDRRSITLTPHGAWAERLGRFAALEDFLRRTDYAEAVAAYLQGDASARSYARLAASGRNAILMNAPKQPDGPPIWDGKPYSALVHLAEDVKPFVAVDLYLRGCGYSAPEIYAHDLDRGFLLLEDLGDRVYTAEAARGVPLEELYEPAVDLLVSLAAEPAPSALSIPGDGAYQLPPYDRGALMTELDLLVDWFWPAIHGKPAPEALRAAYRELWLPFLDALAEADSGLVLRDYHSPNLVWLPDREGLKRVGLLDFQDALIGPRAYDLVSLLQDARLDVPAPLEARLLDRYCAAREAADKSFSAEQFRALYALLGAQRNSKILGIFSRLAKRDGKRAYLAHMPRVARYLERCLSHPSLRPLLSWYQAQLPASADLPPREL
jgi:N-acetylmuramate 1-kinase